MPFSSKKTIRKMLSLIKKKAVLNVQRYRNEMLARSLQSRVQLDGQHFDSQLIFSLKPFSKNNP